jgi:hypothetical protein
MTCRQLVWFISFLGVSDLRVCRNSLVAAAWFAALLLACEPARALPVEFQGSAQDLNLTLTASGNAKVSAPQPIGITLIGTNYAVGTVSLAPDGFTYVVANNPATLPVSEKSTVSLTTDPRSVGLPPIGKAYPAPSTDLGFTGTELTSASGLHLDLLNGASLSYTLSDVIVPRTRMIENEFYDGDPINGPEYYPFKSASIVFRPSGIASTLYIEQDATKLPTFVSDGIGTGTFSVPSILHGTFTNTLQFGGIGFPTFESQPGTNFNLNGRYKITGPPGNATLELAGLQNVSLPLYSLSLAQDGGPVYSITTTIDLTGAALNFALNYSLTTQVAIPEPGSVLLLVVGLIALAPLALRRVRHRR